MGVPIASVEVDHKGRLLVRPDTVDTTFFDYIYRSATGVRWQASEHAFYPDEAKGADIGRWFQIIAASVRDELGVELEITPATTWVRVPVELRQLIEAYAKSKTV